jgi:hypothetical protein
MFCYFLTGRRFKMKSVFLQQTTKISSAFTFLKKWISGGTRVGSDAGKAFFDIEKNDNAISAGKKVATTGLRRVVYGLLDYWAMLLSAAYILIIDQIFGYSIFVLFIFMWAFDIVFAGIMIILWKRTKQDVTLGESYRRAVDVIHKSNKFAGYLSFIGVCIKAAFWSGPEYIIIFFEKELKTELRMVWALLMLTAIQSAIWTPIYVYGFDGISELLAHIF